LLRGGRIPGAMKFAIRRLQEVREVLNMPSKKIAKDERNLNNKKKGKVK